MNFGTEPTSVLNRPGRTLNFHFANEIADEDLSSEAAALEHRKTIYEKCAIVMAGHGVALSLLHAIAILNSEKMTALAKNLSEKAAALLDLASKYTESRY